jgi:hypothetical protein
MNNNVFEEIYQEAFENRLVKIAEANNVDPQAFIKALEKRAGVGTIIKKEVGNTVASAKNLLDATKGFGKGVYHKGVEKFLKARGQNFQSYAANNKATKELAAMKAALPHAKRALVGVGAVGAGTGTYAATK